MRIYIKNQVVLQLLIKQKDQLRIMIETNYGRCLDGFYSILAHSDLQLIRIEHNFNAKRIYIS